LIWALTAGLSAAANTVVGTDTEVGLVAYAAYDVGKTAVEVKEDIDAGRLDAAASKVGGLTGTIIGGVGASKLLGKGVTGAAGEVVGEATEAKALDTAANKGVSASGAFDDATVAVLKNGYYEVNGFRFSEYYYEKLWGTGRGAPSLVAKEVLASGVKGAPDALKSGFYRYEAIGWEMIYNPTTREVWHIQPTK